MSQKKSKIAGQKKGRDISLRLTIVMLGTFLLMVFGAAFLINKPSAAFCANSDTCIKDLSGKKETSNDGVFMGKSVKSPNVPNTPTYEIAKAREVLGTSTANNKHIYVDLSRQHLLAYEGSNLFMDVPISSGKWHATPTGDFSIWVWLRATRMAGGNPATGTYYNLPNVPYTMYFSNNQVPKASGFSLHGAYWHNNFGHPMSHGCVNMIIADAQKLFYWSNPSITGWTTYATSANPSPIITVYGQPPAEETAFID